MEDAIWMNKAASARYIKENRTRLGISQVELADRVGVSRNVVYMWEAGNNMPSATNRKALEAEFSKKFVKGASKQKQGKRNDLPQVKNPVPVMPPNRKTEEEMTVEISAWMLFAIVVIAVTSLAIFLLEA